MSVQAWYRQACAYEQLKQHAAAEVSTRRAMDTARYTLPCQTLQVQHACCLILAVVCAQSLIVEAWEIAVTLHVKQSTWSLCLTQCLLKCNQLANNIISEIRDAMLDQRLACTAASSMQTAACTVTSPVRQRRRVLSCVNIIKTICSAVNAVFRLKHSAKHVQQ